MPDDPKDNQETPHQPPPKEKQGGPVSNIVDDDAGRPGKVRQNDQGEDEKND